MGLFGSLLGWDQAQGAVAVVLASNLLDKLSPNQRKQIAQEIAEVICRTERRSEGGVLESLSAESRVVQMGFVVLACDSLGINPFPQPFNIWPRLSNPYLLDDQVDKRRLDTAISLLEKRGVFAFWPGGQVRVDFVRMLRDGVLIRHH